jgi:hypothetical protein
MFDALYLVSISTSSFHDSDVIAALYAQLEHQQQFTDTSTLLSRTKLQTKYGTSSEDPLLSSLN